MKTDSYKTITKPVEGLLYKDRKSKFYGYAYPIHKVEDVKPVVAAAAKTVAENMGNSAVFNFVSLK